jgi:hypothetical protein
MNRQHKAGRFAQETTFFPFLLDLCEELATLPTLVHHQKVTVNSPLRLRQMMDEETFS